MKRIGWLLIVGSMVPAVVFAAPNQNEGSCRAEVQSVCGEYRGNRGKRRACIKANQSQFSEVCQAKFARRAQSNSDGRRPGCRRQVKSICGNHRGDPRAMKICFESNREQFTAHCQARLEARDWSKRGGKQGQCRTVIKNLCEHHRGDKAAMHTCVQASLGQLSDACKRRIQRRLARHGGPELDGPTNSIN